MAKKGALPPSPETNAPLLVDRAILSDGGKSYAVWLVLTKQDEIIVYTAGKQQQVVYKFTVIDLRKVRGMSNHLNFYVGTIARPVRLQLLPALRNPTVYKPGLANGQGVAGNIISEKKMERYSNIKLWVSVLREYNLDVRYKSYNFVFIVTFVSALAGIVLLAGIFLSFPILIGILQAFSNR